MSKINDYRARLRQLENWEPFLLAESGLPGPRGNLELVQAAADEGSETQFRAWLAYDEHVAPTGGSEEFLAVCGAVGLGRLLAEGRWDLLADLRQCASDSRWRMREGVAMALQRLGDRDMGALIEAVRPWSEGNPYEQRAAAAALCEPRLLSRPEHVREVLAILDRITARIAATSERKSEPFQALRKGLGYCWSVAVVALPSEGTAAMEKWFGVADPDIRWVMRENLKKDRLLRMDRGWVELHRTEAS